MLTEFPNYGHTENSIPPGNSILMGYKIGYSDTISLWYECSSLSKAIKLAKALHLIL